MGRARRKLERSPENFCEKAPVSEAFSAKNLGKGSFPSQNPLINTLQNKLVRLRFFVHPKKFAIRPEEKPVGTRGDAGPHDRPRILEKTLEFAPGEWLLSSYIATGIENVPPL